MSSTDKGRAAGQSTWA